MSRINRARDLTKSGSISSRYLTFYIDSIGITTTDMDKIKRAAGYI